MAHELSMWGYGAMSVLFISVVGICGILIIPMIKNHHGNIIQLLVGLAIGTLTSDALLHLLPHTFSGHSHKHTASDLKSHSHDKQNHSHDNHDHAGHDHGHGHLASFTSYSHSVSVADSGYADQHMQNIFYGLVALFGIFGFLIIQRGMTIISDIWHNSHRKTSKIANCDRTVEKVAQPNMKNEACETDKLTIDTIKISKEKPALLENGHQQHLSDEPITELPLAGDNSLQLTTEQCHRETILFPHPDPEKGFVVQLTEHHHHHQHHQHQSSTVGSVIMIIVTGDGLHNFFDGLAIGIAFMNGGVGGGLSTSIAILCHELPHEVGDFAVLLSTGLSVKRALLFNIISSILCFIGMSVGIFVGKLDTGYCSAIIAGMFLYIALVNMIPQLDCCPMQSSGHRALKLSIQVGGICIGVAIMFIISLFEDQLQTMLDK